MNRRLPIIIYTRKPRKTRQRRSVIKNNKRTRAFKHKIRLNSLLLILLVFISVVVAPFALKDKNNDDKQTTKETSTKTNIINEVQAGAKLQGYEIYYYPLVTNNIDSYNANKPYDNKKLIVSCIWSLLRNEDKGTLLDNCVVLRASDIESEYKKIFGTKNKPEHFSIKTDAYNIVYDENTKTYKIPIMGISPMYTPEFESMEQDGSQLVLCVGCLSSSKYMQNSKGQTVKPKAEKYLYIYLKKSAGVYYVDKVESYNKML